MFPQLAIALCLLALGFSWHAQAFDAQTTFVNTATLAAPDEFVVHWNYNSTDIVFKLVAKNAKWLGFGFSPNGDMDYSDVVVGFLNANGSANFTRRTILQAPTMYVNPNQQVTLLHMSVANNFTTLVFTRKIAYCLNSTGTTHVNMDIISGTQYLIVSCQ